MSSSSVSDTSSASIFGAQHRRLTLGVTATVVFIAFEAMAVATAMPKAVPDLDGLPLYALAFSGYLTTSLIGLVVAGEVSDRRGPRLPLLAGALTFCAGLLIAGLAQSMWPFVAARAIQGFGGGLVIVALYVVVARAYSEELRPRVFAVMSAAWVVPSIVGPLVAGLLADHVSWRWAFLGIVPIVLATIALTMPMVRAVDGPPASGPSVRRGRKRLALATAVGMGLLQYAGTRLDLLALGLAVIAVALLVPSVPRLLPPGALRLKRGLPTVIAMRGILAGAFFGAEAFLPLMLVAERGLSSTLAGLSLTGGALGWAAGAWYQGRPGMRTPRYLLVRVGCGLVALAIAALSLVLLPVVPPFVAMAMWAVGALGMGMSIASLSVLLFELAPPEDHGVNSAAIQVSETLFTITFVGLAGTIFGTAHGPSSPGDALESSVPTWVYAAILAVMSGVAVFGAWAAGRIRPSSR